MESPATSQNPGPRKSSNPEGEMFALILKVLRAARLPRVSFKVRVEVSIN